MPPRLPRKTGNPRMLAVEEAVRAYLEREANLVDRRATPTKIVNSDYHAKPGEFVLCNSSSGAFSVYLPTITRSRIGQSVLVVAWGSSSGAILTNNVTVRPSDGGAVIAASQTLVISTVNLVYEFIAVTMGKWLVR